LAEIKKEKYKYNKSITVTANEQDSFFDVVEVAISEIFPELKGKLKHLSHGMLRLPSGKMSSRTGDIISAEILINQVKEKVLEKIADRNFDEKEKGEIAEMVAIGAIKYSILKQAIGGDIIFGFDKSISFEGDSGPYLQYACVRANSILDKAKHYNTQKVSKMPFDTWEITELERYLYRFEEVVEKAGREYAPHYIVTYLTELAGMFNAFYANNKIIDENDPSSPYKLALTSATAYILKSGLHLLGIRVPNKM
jgi:arginyl-tRNA synthetase